MSVKVRLPTPLRPFADGRDHVDLEAATVADALDGLTVRFPRLRRHLFTDDGELRSFVNVFVNQDDVRDLAGRSTSVSAGDVLSIVPSIAGGSETSAPTELPTLSSEEVLRYSRHILLPEVGWEGQRRLKASKVLLVGVGGLGSPIGLYLAAAGVGTLGLVDFDVVDETNLQRQVLYGTGDIGRPKLDAAAARLREMNPHLSLHPHPVRLGTDNALDLFAGYDVIVDGSDNFPTRYLVNDACVLLGKPYVYGSIFRFEGQVSVFGAPGGPCYRCLFREPPPPGLVPSCAEGGVLGVLPGIIGSVQALETIKLIVGAGEPMVGRIALFDALAMRWRELRLRRNPECPACGDHPSLTGLIDYEEFCGIRPLAGGRAEPTPELSPAQLKARLERGDRLTLLDLREPDEWKIANLAAFGARLIPFAELGDRMGELDADAEVVLLCRSGGRSVLALRQLRAAGFSRLWHLTGGISAWAEQVDPAMQRY